LKEIIDRFALCGGEWSVSVLRSHKPCGEWWARVRAAKFCLKNGEHWSKKRTNSQLVKYWGKEDTRKLGNLGIYKDEMEPNI